jgi:flagellar biosynthesis protein FlhF
MGFKRFVAATTRDAMRQVRQELGEDAVILSSKKIAGGHFEILAAAADAVEAIVEDTRKPRAAAPARPVSKAGGIETFQDYLKRQGQQRARTASAPQAPAERPQAATRAPSATAMYEDVANAPAQDPQAAVDSWWDAPAAVAPIAPRATAAAVSAQVSPRVPVRTTIVPPPAEPAVFRRRPTRDLQDDVVPVASQPREAAMTAPGARVSAEPVAAPAQPTIVPATGVVPTTTTPSIQHTAPTPLLTPAASAPTALGEIQVPQAPVAGGPQLMAELQSLRAALQDQLNAISSTVAADSLRRNPLMARLMTRLLTAGFSAEVARRVAQHAPGDLELASSQEWLQSVIAMNLKCTDSANALVDRSGVFALVGPTGVGKTTTVAKLAARFAVKYGTNALGLITLDAYRVAAHEQLRAYGRILGTPVHLAQDSATLRELLASMRGKRLVLIDTCGVGPRDERLNEMLAMLTEAGRDAQRVQPVLLLNAGSHTETLDETARAWRAQQAAGCILTKLDEAARVGGALDCALRYKLTLLALTNGQRVPEDLHLPNAKLLAHLALKPGGQAFALAESEATALAAAH